MWESDKSICSSPANRAEDRFTRRADIPIPAPVALVRSTSSIVSWWPTRQASQILALDPLCHYDPSTSPSPVFPMEVGNVCSSTLTLRGATLV